MYLLSESMNPRFVWSKTIFLRKKDLHIFLIICKINFNLVFKTYSQSLSKPISIQIRRIFVTTTSMLSRRRLKFIELIFLPNLEFNCKNNISSLFFNSGPNILTFTLILESKFQWFIYKLFHCPWWRGWELELDSKHLKKWKINK